MNEETKRIRELIEKNRTEQALERLIELTGNDKDLQIQASTLAAKWKDVRRKENLGLISSNEAFSLHAQVNYAALNLANEYDQTNPDHQPLQKVKSVFISYSHRDREIAQKIKEKLNAHSINVTIDSESMAPGDDIKQFIEKSIRDTAAIISIISKNSLLSAWVAMETMNTFQFEKIQETKKFIPCYIDEDFLNRSFTDSAYRLISKELRQLETMKKKRAEKGRNTRDIDNEYTRLKELSTGLDEIIRRLREQLCIDMQNDNFDNGIIKIIKSIET